MLKVDPKPREKTSDFSLAHLTAYSVHWLDTWDIPSTYENISVLNARLFPADFGMREFPELPDAFRTNRSLLQMRPKYRNFAASDPRKGVYLTEKGRSEVRRVIEALGCPSLSGDPVEATPIGTDPRAPTKGKERTRNPSQIIADRRNRVLFRRFQEGRLDEADVVHLLGLLGLYDHSPAAELKKEIATLRKDAMAIRDGEFMAFLDRVEERFESYLNRNRDK